MNAKVIVVVDYSKYRILTTTSKFVLVISVLCANNGSVITMLGFAPAVDALSTRVIV